MTQSELYQIFGSLQSSVAHIKENTDKLVERDEQLALKIEAAENRIDALERKDIRQGGFIAGVSFVAGMTGVVISSAIAYGSDLVAFLRGQS